MVFSWSAALSTIIALISICSSAKFIEFITCSSQRFRRRYGFFHGSVTSNYSFLMDTAVVHLQNHLADPVTLYGQENECEGCRLLPLATSGSLGNVSAIVRTIYAVDFAVRNGSDELCRFGMTLEEYGVYTINVTRKDNSRVECMVSSEPTGHNSNAAFFVLLGIIGAITIGWNLIGFLLVMRKKRLAMDHRFAVASTNSEELTSSSSDGSLVKPPSRRLRSLDTFRGLTILLMIFVNEGAGGYSYLSHAPWNGLTIADCLFPWFMFIMGISINISLQSAFRRGIRKSSQMVHILRRSTLLFLLGLLINSMGYKSMATLRIPSVLGRFSISYLVVASCELLFIGESQTVKIGRWKAFGDIIPFWPNYLIALIFPLLHIMLTFLVKVPGCPTGYLGPGGLHMNSSYENCTGGAAGYIDQQVLGNSHIYQFPTARQIYQTGGYDPEGILGYLTSIFLVFLGVQAGRIMLIFTGPREKLIRLAIWGTVLGLLSGMLCLFSKNDGWIPVNKNLWSVSYVLCMACFGMFILMAMYYVIDVAGWWDGSPFHYPSPNSIILYVGSEILDRNFPFSWNMPDNHAAQLFMATWTTSLWLLISIWMDWRKIAISL